MKKSILTIILWMAIVFIANAQLKNDYVPNEDVAKSIAKIIWMPIYGQRIEKFKLITTLTPNGIWIVKGQLDRGTQGGVPYIYIRKKDCKILKLYHTK